MIEEIKEEVKKVNKWWRPSKIQGFLVWMKKVIEEDINAIILTDEELFTLANDELEEKYQISYTTFKVYKASKKDEEKAWYSEFQSLYKKALTKQKKDLFDSLKSDPQAWQRFAWIIERKFDSWNLRKIVEWEINKKIVISKEDAELLDEVL